MKTGEIAKAMDVSAKTITNWTDRPELAQYFSTTARASDIESAQRDYSTEDLYVINTIRLTKTHRNSWRDVAQILSSGHRELELPIAAALTKTISPADQVASMMALKAARDTAVAQLQDAIIEIERLRDEVKAERDRADQVIAEERNRTQIALNTEHEKSAKMLSELNREVGRLGAIVDNLTAELKKKDDAANKTDGR